MDYAGLRDLAAEGGVAFVFGIIGRLLHISMMDRRPLGWGLLWELPVALGMGLIGVGLGDWLVLKAFPQYAVTIAIAYLGPRVIDYVLIRYGMRASSPEEPK